MFPLHQGNELGYQISINSYQQDRIPEDLNLGRVLYNNMGKNRKRKLFSTSDENNEKCSCGSDEKKKMHRDIERQRRQELATLYVSLRSLLPLEFIKGKRSMSDHMNESANYIKHLQKKIKELAAKRDELKKLSNFLSITDRNSCGFSTVAVHPCGGGVKIVISSGSRENGLPISRVLEVLLEGGHSVISCNSTKTNDQLLCTIQSEVGDLTEVDLCGLEQKLTKVMIPSLGSMYE